MSDTQGTLYIVGTPIGNLGDISPRAVETLRQVDCIACEDTRHTLGLLNHLDIRKPLVACHKFNESECADRLAARLLSGENIALVSDAGMPAISDPGAKVVQRLRESGCRIAVVPGPTAVTSAVALCGLTQGIWTFVGFLPERKKDRRALLQQLTHVPGALVFYCSPHDLSDTLDELAESLGARRFHLVRELTKLYESYDSGVLGEYTVEQARGEYVIVVEPADPPAQTQAPQDASDYASQVAACMASGMDKKSAIKEIARRYSVPKDVVYKSVLESES